MALPFKDLCLWCRTGAIRISSVFLENLSWGHDRRFSPHEGLLPGFLLLPRCLMPRDPNALSPPEVGTSLTLPYDIPHILAWKGLWCLPDEDHLNFLSLVLQAATFSLAVVAFS